MVSGSSGAGSSPGRSTVLCSWARHFTLTVPLTNKVHKWEPAKLMLGGIPVMYERSKPSRGGGGGVEIPLGC